MGGKARIARKIVEAILSDTPNRDRWIEPFVGGGSVIESAAPMFSECIGLDAHSDLILMWQAVVNGWEPPNLTSERYRELRGLESSPERGYAGFGASFGGKWFGGYGVSPRDGEVWKASQRTISRQAMVFRRYGVAFACGRFGDFEPACGDVVYCDPPYAGTTGYSAGEFDHESFFETLIQWVELGCAVYVSEYAVPEWVPAHVIWSRNHRNILERGDNQSLSIEKLYRIGCTCSDDLS